LFFFYFEPLLSRVNNDDILRGLNALNLDEIKSRNDAEQFMEAYEPLQSVRQFLLKNLYRKENGGFGWRFNLDALTEHMDKVGFAIETEHQVSAPTLFMRGGNSGYVKDSDWDAISELFPNAQLVTIPGAGHWIQAEQPALFEEALMEFLNTSI
jgi:esterase